MHQGEDGGGFLPAGLTQRLREREPGRRPGVRAAGDPVMRRARVPSGRGQPPRPGSDLWDPAPCFQDPRGHRLSPESSPRARSPWFCPRPGLQVVTNQGTCGSTVPSACSTAGATFSCPREGRGPWWDLLHPPPPPGAVPSTRVTWDGTRERSRGKGPGVRQTRVTRDQGLHPPEPRAHLRMWVGARDRDTELGGPRSPAEAELQEQGEGGACLQQGSRTGPGAGLRAPACGQPCGTLALLQLDLRWTFRWTSGCGLSSIPFSFTRGWVGLFRRGTSGVLVVWTPRHQRARVWLWVGGRRWTGLPPLHLGTFGWLCCLGRAL